MHSALLRLANRPRPFNSSRTTPCTPLNSSYRASKNSQCPQALAAPAIAAVWADVLLSCGCQRIAFTARKVNWSQISSTSKLAFDCATPPHVPNIQIGRKCKYNRYLKRTPPKLKHSQQLLLISNHRYTGMLSEHVSSHLICMALLHCDFLLLMHSVPHKVIPRENLLGARMVHRVVDDVDGWLTIQENPNGSVYISLACHLHLLLM